MIGVAEGNPNHSAEEAAELDTTAVFYSELQSEEMTPEERAIRIEQWLEKQDPLLEEARRGRVGPLTPTGESASDRSRLTEGDAAMTVEVPEDPLLADIHEIEEEILDFRNSLDNQNLTAEQRAVQIERFHEINGEVLRHLESLKREAASRRVPEGASQTMPSDSGQGTAYDQAGLKAEIDRIMSDLAQVDPETRALYIETHANTIKAMSDELLRSFVSESPLLPNTNPSETK